MDTINNLLILTVSRQNIWGYLYEILLKCLSVFELLIVSTASATERLSFTK